MSANRGGGPWVVIAPDSFKGTFSAADVSGFIAEGIRESGAQADLCPLADGGEGTLAILMHAIGGQRLPIDAQGPWGDPLKADICLLDNGVVVVEAANASGLTVPTAGDRDPETASTAGTGELIAAAVAAGARHILVTVGGTATTDGGFGAISAIDRAGGLGGATLTVLCDVSTTYTEAAALFGPQKGADPEAVIRLTSRLHQLAERLPRDPRTIPYSGAGGGLAGGLWAAFGAELVSGAERVLAAVGFHERLARAAAVVVGEGRLDSQTFEGKIINAVAVLARELDVPVHAVVGSLEADRPLRIPLASIIIAGDPVSMRQAGAAIGRRVVNLNPAADYDVDTGR